MTTSSQTVPAFVRLAAHPLRWRLLATLSGGDYRVRELATLIGEPQNLISYHLRLLREGGLVRAARSSFDGRDSYYQLDLDSCGRLLSGVATALHPALGQGPAPVAAGGRAQPPGVSTPPVSVLFVCTGNTARSAIAEALLRRHSGGRAEAVSAGTRPKPGIHPNTTRVLRELFGLDISGQRPRDLETLAGRRFDAVVTLCDKAREVCPDFGEGTRRIHWSVADPAAGGGADEESYPRFHAAALEIDTRVRYLLPILVPEPSAG